MNRYVMAFLPVFISAAAAVPRLVIDTAEYAAGTFNEGETTFLSILSSFPIPATAFLRFQKYVQAATAYFLRVIR
jgi:hypothetical protein